MIKIKSNILYKYFIIIFFICNIVLVGCEQNNINIYNTETNTKIIINENETKCDESILNEQEIVYEEIDDTTYFTIDSYYANRTSASRICQNENIIYYSNVFDDRKLYLYNMNTDEDILLTDKVYKVQFISIFGNKIYFSGMFIDNPENFNIYSIDNNGENLKFEIENAKGAIIDNGYIYYHDSYDDFEFGLYRKNIKTEEVEELLNKEYQCSDMTINIVGDCIYAHNLYDIIKYNINTHEITNITSGKYEYGLNKLQYHNGFLYYYTYYENAMIKRIDVNTGIEEDVLIFNNGDFWYDVLLVTNDYIFFKGSQYTVLKDGDSEENIVRGTFKYSISEDKVYKIYNKSLGPTFYLINDFIIAILSIEDNGTNEIIILDYDGNDISYKYPNLIS